MRTRQVVVAASCVAAVFVAAACHQADKKPAPLKQNPVEARRQAFHKERSAASQAARRLTWEQAAALDAEWQRDPENLATLETLLIFYAPDSTGKPDANSHRKNAARRRLILWLIEHHPEHRLAAELSIRNLEQANGWLRDPVLYEAAKELWLKHAAAPAAPFETRLNAVTFFYVSDKPIAERLALQYRAADVRPEWSDFLGTLYAEAIVGPSSLSRTDVIRVRSGPEKSTYADEVNRTLAGSSDAAVVGATGTALLFYGSQNADSDLTARGRMYLERAVQLDPRSPRASRTLDFLLRQEQSKREETLMRGTPSDARPEAIAKLPDPDRLRMLTRLANDEYMTAEAQEWRAKHPETAADVAADAVAKNRELAQRGFQRSKLYARQALDLADKLPNEPYYPVALFQANLALGAHAFREGDRQTAVRYMLDASRVPRSRVYRTNEAASVGSLESRLIGQLLKHGERDTVIEYFERLALNGSADADRPRKAAEAIRDGYWPTDYSLSAAQQN